MTLRYSVVDKSLSVFILREITEPVINCPAFYGFTLSKPTVDIKCFYRCNFGIKIIFKVSDVFQRAEKLYVLLLCFFGIEMTVFRKT